MNGFRLVLASPKFAGNVGACARVAANFDVSDLVLARPLCDPASPESLARAMPPADRYLRGARIAPDLTEALTGCRASVGFTRRTGKARLTLPLPELLPALRALAPSAEAAPIALVFGNEETGLTDGELQLCTHLATISISEVMPSLNLSHAVAVVLARLQEEFGEPGEIPRERGARPATLEELEGLFAHWRQAIADAGMTTAGNPDRLLRRIRRLIQRAEPLSREVKLLHGFLSKARLAMGTRKTRRLE